MSNLVSVPKNGTLVNTNSNFPNWTNWLDDVFNSDLPSVFNSSLNTGMNLPKVNIKETADSYLLEMAVPGLKKSDFQLDLNDKVLSIYTEKQEENEHKEESFTRKEFAYTSFKRAFNLPESVDEDKINAKYKDGILNIHLPKKEEAKKKPARNIKIS